MLQKARFFATSLLLLVLAATVTSTPANAWPLGKVLHMHPTAEQDARITLHLFNKTEFREEVKVGELTYIIEPHCGLLIKAPEGTQVFSARTTPHHRDGDLLFAVTEKMKNSTITID